MLPNDTPPTGGGLYIIWLSDTHYYGGRARSFKVRWRNHLRDLKAGKHENPRMQAVFNIYGRFDPKALAPLPPEQQEAAEQQWLDEHFRKPGCVNLSPLAKGGCENRSPETRAKMAHTRATRPDLVAKARQVLDQNRLNIDPAQAAVRARKMSENNQGRVQTPESIEKRAVANRGRKNTPGTLALMSESAKKRATVNPTSHGPETRTLISEQQRGRVWINNGVQNSRVFPESIPDGWVRGKLPHRPR